jgi:hypothetical protein
VKATLTVLAILALLLIGGRDRDDPPTVEFESTSAAPAVVEPPLQPVPLEVPLSVSETTPPPGWTPPPTTAEGQLAAGVQNLGGQLAWQLALAVVAILVVLGLMFYVEQRRQG